MGSGGKGSSRSINRGGEWVEATAFEWWWSSIRGRVITFLLNVVTGKWLLRDDEHVLTLRASPRGLQPWYAPDDPTTWTATPPSKRPSERMRGEVMKMFFAVLWVENEYATAEQVQGLLKRALDARGWGIIFQLVVGEQEDAPLAAIIRTTAWEGGER